MLARGVAGGAGFQQLFQQVDTPAWAVAFVAPIQVSRAGCQAEAAVYTGADQLACLDGVIVILQAGVEINIHGAKSSYTGGPG